GNLTGLGVLLAIWVVYAVYFSPTQGWTFFFQLTVNGIILGSIYALIALGYSMVYGILKLLNFAHGDVYMIGSFIGFGVLTLLGADYRNYDGYDLISYNGIHLGGSAGVFVSYLGVLVISGALLLMVALVALVRWTRFGKAMRAVSFDREAAAMMGIDPDRVIATTFLVGSALGGA